MKTREHVLLAATFVVMGIQSAALGLPSGFKPLPQLQRPKIDGRALSIDMLPDQEDPKTIWVIPKEGEFVSQGVVKSPAANCETLKEALKLDDYANRMRNQLAAALLEAQADYTAKQKEYRRFAEKKGVLSEQIPALKAAVAKITTHVDQLIAEFGGLKKRREAIEKEMAIEEDKQKLTEKEAELTRVQNELGAKKREITTLQKDAADKDAALSEMEVDLAGVKGKAAGIEDDLNRLLERINRNKATIDGFEASAEKVLTKYSRQVGAYASYVTEFAPARFLELLEAANKGYSFRYVPSITAVVDATIPETAGSALEKESGSLILASKWSDPKAARLREYYKALDTFKTFPKELLAGKDVNAFLPTVVKQVQEKLDEARRAEYESSLSGTKFLALKLSTLGYCALKEPHALGSELVGGPKDTFKLAMHFTFPVHYSIDVHGHFNSQSYLYDFWQMTKSSSWFGLRKSQKLEHVRRLNQDTSIDVKVTPRGVALDAQQSWDLTQKVKDQLTYFAAQPFLEVKGGAQVASFDNGPLGASSAGQRLMLIPNPWAFWGGVILTTLGEMFGSSTQTAITEMKTQRGEKLHYEAGFTFLLPGDITVGDLTRAKEEVREIRF